MISKDIRWKQRFYNFEKALFRLNNAVNAHKQDSKNELFQMALIQAFEFTNAIQQVYDYFREKL
ncbi:nucleotidyltransferase substrate-binding protein [Candidatus Magnetomorum sp. HK-1]|nr:nucleotidyltransferase substrate-binding protein [Candidatus Magnetomorum sp. HK-1]